MDLISPEISERESAILEYTHLVDFHVRKVSRKLPAKSDLNDVRQAGMLGLIDAYDRFDSSQNVSFKTFADKFVQGAVLDCVKALRPAGDLLDDQMQIEDTNCPDAEYQIERMELHAMVIKQIDRLPKKVKIMLALYYIEELKMNEIAIVMDCTESWVSQILSAARLDLRRVMESKLRDN